MFNSKKKKVTFMMMHKEYEATLDRASQLAGYKLLLGRAPPGAQERIVMKALGESEV